MRLPTFTECSDLVDKDQANPLEVFIYENEPAGNEDSNEFRKGLIDVLHYAIENINEKIVDGEDDY